MLTREEIAETLRSEPNNRRVYGLYNFERIHPILARDIDTDAGIAFDAQTANIDRAKRGEISEGDYICCADYRIHRIASIHKRDPSTGSIKYQPGKMGTGGGFFQYSDSMSMSGSLDHTVETRVVSLSSETIPARVWFFSLNDAGPGRGVYCWIHVPVWREVSP